MHTHTHPRSGPAATVSWFLTITVAFAAYATSQCAPQWQQGPPVPGTDNNVYAVTEWDPDGPGPSTPVLVFAGNFTAAGHVVANRVVAFDPANGTWTPLGSGRDAVGALAVLPNGDLVAASSVFASTFTHYVERWNGTAWVPLGTAFNGGVGSLAVLPNGDLIAAGNFTQASGTAANRIARWDGSAWSPLGVGLSAEVMELAVLPNGDLVVGGWFSQAGGILVNSIARWDGAGWSSLGAGMNGYVFGLTIAPNGDVIAGGPFFSAGGTQATGIARWNGTFWSNLGAGLPGDSPSVVAALPNGDILAGSNRLMRWNGVAWSQLGAMSGSLSGLLPTNGAIVVGGSFGSVDGVVAANIAIWNGLAWSQFGPPSAPTKLGVIGAGLDSAPILAARDSVNGVIPSRVSRWTGSAWSTLGAGFTGGFESLLTTSNGDFVVGGLFFAVGGVPVNSIARWDGSTWSPLGSGVTGGSGGVLALAELPGGDIVAGGSFTTAGGVPAARIARWNGSTWSPIGAGLGAFVTALAAEANGDFVAGGTSSLLGGSSVARWNGTNWVGLGSISGSVTALLVLPGGDIVAGGTFAVAGGAPVARITRWNGTTWLPLGSGMSSTSGSPNIKGLVGLPDGDLVASGFFTHAGGLPAAGIARWDGGQWISLASNVAGATRSLAIAPDGSILCAQSTVVDGVVSAGFARLWTPCPATALPSGVGCTGSGGANVLAALALPWTGATYRGLATGMPAAGVALGVYGLSSLAVPLPSLVPEGVAGCVLQASPDFVVTLLPNGGKVATQLSLPNTATLVGLPLYEQVLALDFLGGSFSALTGTNRLVLTIGTL